MIKTETRYTHPFKHKPGYICHVFECPTYAECNNCRALKQQGWKVTSFRTQNSTVIIIYRKGTKVKDFFTLFFLDAENNVLCQPGDKVWNSKTYICGKLNNTMTNSNENNQPIFGIDSKGPYAEYEKKNCT